MHCCNWRMNWRLKLWAPAEHMYIWAIKIKIEPWHLLILLCHLVCAHPDPRCHKLIKLQSVFLMAQRRFLHFTRLETDLWGEGGWFVRGIRQLEIGPEEATSGEMACCYCVNPDHTDCRLSDNRLYWMLAFLWMKPWLVIFKKGILIMILLHLIRTLGEGRLSHLQPQDKICLNQWS